MILAEWRKTNTIHGWFVSKIRGGVFKLGDKSVNTERGDVNLSSYLPGSYTCPVSLENEANEKLMELDYGRETS